MRIWLYVFSVVTDACVWLEVHTYMIYGIFVFDIVCLSICLFGVYPTTDFHSFGDVTGEGLQILTYDRHSWPLSSEGSLTCHTYCDTGLPFIMVISEDQWHTHLLSSVWQWSCHYLFLRLRSVATGDRTPISRTRGERFTSTQKNYEISFNVSYFWNSIACSL